MSPPPLGRPWAYPFDVMRPGAYFERPRDMGARRSATGKPKGDNRQAAITRAAARWIATHPNQAFDIRCVNSTTVRCTRLK